jgi:hypothetical protein
MFSVACPVPPWSLLKFLASALLGEGAESICDVAYSYGRLCYTCDRVIVKNMVGMERYTADVTVRMILSTFSKFCLGKYGNVEFEMEQLKNVGMVNPWEFYGLGVSGLVQL